MASDTAHCGQKQIRFADDFCLGLTPTVCANMYTATDLSPASISRRHRKQTIFCTIPPDVARHHFRLPSPEATSVYGDSAAGRRNCSGVQQLTEARRGLLGFAKLSNVGGCAG